MHVFRKIAAAGALLMVALTGYSQDTSIHPFRISVPQSQLDDLRQRINSTRWPDKETVADASTGAQLANMQGLLRYWGSGYDWRKTETKLNSLPQFRTNIDGLDIYFIHVRSRQKKALPMILTHGWPGSVLEFINTIGPLTDPTAHGASAEDAFDVVIPSIPGYGFSGRPTSTGWDPERIARAWDILMKRLGYTRYVAQGGDWGAVITGAMARQAPPGLLAIHINNLAAVVPPDVGAALAGAAPLPAGLSDEERASVERAKDYAMKGSASYFVMLTTRPQAMGYGLTDSPAGLAAFMLVHPGFANWTYGADPAKLPTKDQVLDDFTLYWLTNTSASAARLYWENHGASPTLATAQKASEVSLPVAITVFGEDAFRPPESWARRAYRSLTYFHEVEKGGHFAAWEQPELFATELRAAFKQFRGAP